MGLFDNNNGSLFGSDHTTDGTPSPPPSGSPSNPFDGSGNPFGGLGSKLDDSGGMFDGSGVDISGGWKQEAKTIGKGLAQMVMYGLAAGLIVVVLFVSAQDLVWLTKKEHISSIPTNIKAPPYAKGQVTGHKFLYGYGAPYSFKDHPILFPFIPCNFPKLQTFFHIKPWIGKTLAHTWADSRNLLKVVLNGLSGLNIWIKMLGGVFIMLGMLILTPIVSTIFTFVSAFRTNVGWSILATIFGILPLISLFVTISQFLVMIWYLFFSTLTTHAGRNFIKESVYEHRKHLRLLYILVVIGMSPLYLPRLITVGMIVGILLFGY